MTKYDKALVILVLIISTIIIYSKGSTVNSNENKYVRIESNGKMYKEIELDKNIEKEEIIKTKYGYNKVQIKGFKVRIIEADCHDQVCVKQGYISKTGESLICLPNRLSIEIKSKNNERNVDYISQ